MLALLYGLDEALDNAFLGRRKPQGGVRDVLGRLSLVWQSATGARTPLGVRSAPIAAAYRARINRLGERPSLIDRLGNPMVAALDLELDPQLECVARLCALAETALAEICLAIPRLTFHQA